MCILYYLFGLANSSVQSGSLLEKSFSTPDIVFPSLHWIELVYIDYGVSLARTRFIPVLDKFQWQIVQDLVNPTYFCCIRSVNPLAVRCIVSVISGLVKRCWKNSFAGASLILAYESFVLLVKSAVFCKVFFAAHNKPELSQVLLPVQDVALELEVAFVSPI